MREQNQQCENSLLQKYSKTDKLEVIVVHVVGKLVNKTDLHVLCKSYKIGASRT